jgi:hypothetical protein
LAERALHAKTKFKLIPIVAAVAMAFGPASRSMQAAPFITRTNCGSIDSSNEIRLISGAACLTL